MSSLEYRLLPRRRSICCKRVPPKASRTPSTTHTRSRDTAIGRSHLVGEWRSADSDHWGAGFIGSHLADDLIGHGHLVEALDVSSQVHGATPHRRRDQWQVPRWRHPPLLRRHHSRPNGPRLRAARRARGRSGRAGRVAAGADRRPRRCKLGACDVRTDCMTPARGSRASRPGLDESRTR